MVQRSGKISRTESHAILVDTTTGGAAEEEACTSLLTEEEIAETSVISITLTDLPDERIAMWQRHVGEEYPAETVLISVGGGTLSAAAADAFPADESLSVKSVSGSDQLTELGVRITEAVEEVDTETNDLAVCFHGLTSLLVQSDRKRAYRFLHTLVRYLKSQDARAHFHFDPTLFDEQTIATFESLFDQRLSVEDVTEARLQRQSS